MIYLAVLVPLSATLYCKPRPLLCPVFQTVQYQDEWQNVTEIVVFPINQILLNTVFQVSDVPVTSVTVQTVTAPALQLVMIEVKVVEVTKPLMDGKIPREHKVISHSLKEMTLGVLSEPDLGSSSSDAAVSETQQLSFEGQVIHKLECQPVVDDYYINQKREAVKKAAQSLHTVKLIDRPLNGYKPISHHKHNVYLEQKAEGKTIRDDKDKVMELLFAAFEKHQYYNIKDLHKITRQPITYLKEILKDLCNYNVKNPHKNMWELKPEYRHYKLAEKAVENSMYD
nr:general transcription factor IIF subunit 2-like [Procambarus clarkii]